MTVDQDFKLAFKGIHTILIRNYIGDQNLHLISYDLYRSWDVYLSIRYRINSYKYFHKATNLCHGMMSKFNAL